MYAINSHAILFTCVTYSTQPVLWWLTKPNHLPVKRSQPLCTVINANGSAAHIRRVLIDFAILFHIAFKHSRV